MYAGLLELICRCYGSLLEEGGWSDLITDVLRELELRGIMMIAIEERAAPSVLWREGIEPGELRRLLPDLSIPGSPLRTQVEPQLQPLSSEATGEVLCWVEEITAERWYGILAMTHAPTSSPIQRERFELLAPHLLQAAALGHRLRSQQLERAVGRLLFEHLDVGCVVLDAQARVRWMNEVARDLIMLGDALELGPAGKLLPVLPGSLPTWQAALTQSPGHAPLFKLPRRGGGRDLELLLSPLEPQALPTHGSGQLVFLCDPEQVDEGFATRLGQLHDLTPTEAEIAQWLLSGSSINEISKLFGTSVHTVRTQVKTLMRKVDVGSQRELVGLLQRSVARLG